MIVITGADGSGKTTLCDSLYNELQKRGARVGLVTIWDVLDKNLFLSNVKKEEIDLYLKKCSNTSRSLFLMHSLAQALDHAKNQKPDLLIINSYWYKYFISELLHGADKSWLQNLVSCFENPDLVINLNINPELSLQRKSVISSYESGHAKDRAAGYMTFQTKAQSHWNTLKDDTWVELSSMDSKDELLRKSLDLLMSRGLIP